MNPALKCSRPKYALLKEAVLKDAGRTKGDGRFARTYALSS
jgi:hypothetical protein